ncbi:hypothetical protein Tco_0404862 [Tanacetum coccineum]
MSHHTLYGVKYLQDYAATFKFTRDDVSDSALRRNIGDKGNVGSQRNCNRSTSNEMVSIDSRKPGTGVVKPEIGGNVNFEIKSQFMRELREDTFSENKNDDAHEHVERVLDIVSLFNIPGVSHDAVMLCVFNITLTRSAKRWVDKLPPGTIDSWDLLKTAIIQMYCPPSKTAKQLEEIRNFKLEGDKTLYQAWKRYNDLLYKCPTHDINNHHKAVKSMEEVKYREFGRPFPNNNKNDGRFNKGGYDQPSSGEMRPTPTEIF